jgi:hypothetical protein
MAATDEIIALLVDFINKNSNVADVQWDRRMSPRLLFNPYSDKYEEKKYCYCSQPYLTTQVGYPENARMLIVFA